MDSDKKVPTKPTTPKSSPIKPFGVPASAAQRAKLLSTAFMLLVSTTAGFVGGWYGAKSNSQTSASLTQKASREVISSESQLISSIAKDVGPSVVSVNVTAQAEPQQDMFGFGFGRRGMEQEGSGTGFILNEDGVVVTNRHVVPAGTTSVSVVLSDGTKLNNVDVIGRTNENDPLDVAFLKIKDKQGKKLVPAKLGDSAKMQVGDRVVAIGNALGQFQNTVTSGIISGFGRSVEAGDGSGGNTETLQNLFQTDAAINQGNSGGPLVNTSGEVIGINTAVAAGNAQNVGFAIPINDVQGLIKSVLSKGKLERPYLGVRYVTITDDYAYEFNLSEKRGAYIPPSRSGAANIAEGSPAEKAGLQEKDIITEVEGTKLDENHSLSSVLGKYEVGKKVSLTIKRDGKEQKLDVTLEAAPTQ